MATGFSKVNINTCSYGELLTLPGVGPKTADRIFTLREQGLSIDLETLCVLPWLRVTQDLVELIDFSPAATPSYREIEMATFITEGQGSPTSTLPEQTDSNVLRSEFHSKNVENLDTASKSQKTRAESKEFLNASIDSDLWWDIEGMGTSVPTMSTKKRAVLIRPDEFGPKGTVDQSLPVQGTSTPAGTNFLSTDKVQYQPSVDSQVREGEPRGEPPSADTDNTILDLEIEFLKEQIQQRLFLRKANTASNVVDTVDHRQQVDSTHQQGNLGNQTHSVQSEPKYYQTSPVVQQPQHDHQHVEPSTYTVNNHPSGNHHPKSMVSNLNFYQDQNQTDQPNQHANQQVQQGRQLFKTPQQGTKGGPSHRIKSEPDYHQHNPVVDLLQQDNQRVQPEPYTINNQQPGEYHPKASTPYATHPGYDNNRHHGVNKSENDINNPRQQQGHFQSKPQHRQQVQFTPIRPQQDRQQGHQVDNNYQLPQFKAPAPIYKPPHLRPREAPQVDINTRQQHQPTHSSDPTYPPRGNQSVYYNPDDYTDESSYESDVSTDYHPLVDRRQQDKRQPSYPPRQEHVSRYDNYRHTLSPGGGWPRTNYRDPSLDNRLTHNVSPTESDLTQRVRDLERQIGSRGAMDIDRHHSPVSPQRQRTRHKTDKSFFASLPKQLKYDGKSNWKAFYTKFSGYAEAAGWSTAQKREQLCWCLEGKASDFYTLLLEQDKYITYPEVVQKMEKRFGLQECQATCMVTFQNSFQGVGESLDDWADRVLSLATKAFRGLPEHHMTEQAIMKFCQGCKDQQAGQHACNCKPDTMEKALDTIKWFQHTRTAVQATRPKDQSHDMPKEEKVEPRPQDPVIVHGVGNSKENDKIYEQMTRLEKQLTNKIEEKLRGIESLMHSIRDENRASNSKRSSVSPSGNRFLPSKSPNRNPNFSKGQSQPQRNFRTQTCFNCNKIGHFARECPEPWRPRSPNKEQPRKGNARPTQKRTSFASGRSMDDSTNVTTSVLSLGDAHLLRVKIDVLGRQLTALVDTGSEVTIISDQVFDKLKDPPYIIKESTMHGAGTEMHMKCRITNPVTFKIDHLTFTQQLYVAPLGCEMLLGFDFLNRTKAKLDLEKRTLTIQGTSINLHLGGESQPKSPVVYRVTVRDKVVVPPLSAVRLSCDAVPQDHDFLVEPTLQQDLLIPRTVCSKGQPPQMCFLNIGDTPIKLTKGQDVAEIQEISVLNSMLTPSVGIVTDPRHSRQPRQVGPLPEHLREMFAKSSEHLKPNQKIKLKELLVEYSDIFAKDDFDLGNFTAIEHEIDTGNAKPIKQRMRRTPQCFVDEEEQHLEKMLKAGVIQPSMSDWCSAPVLIRKRDGGVRWCIDYRALNSVTVKDVYPLPLIEECLDTLSDNVWYSKLDANSAYWQVRIKPQDRKKTAFITKYGLFECVKMSFGLCNAPGTYARVMNLLLRGLTWKTVLAFLDDILVLGTDFDQHLHNLRMVFARFRQYQLKLKPRKCELFTKSVEFLGRKISKHGMAINKDHLGPVPDWPVPTCTREIEQFLGFANYHRSFIKNYAKITGPLYEITGKKQFSWNHDRQLAFDTLRDKLMTAPVLALPNNRDYFILDTDASDKAIGAELIQVQNGKERTIAYGSFILTPEQKRYCTTRKELLAVIRFTRQFRHYLLGKQFTVRTDHSSLTWLMNFKEPQAQLARWLEELSQYDMIIKHRPGKAHIDADCLSRIPVREKECPHYATNVKLSELPCKGCTYCTRVHNSWVKFTTDIDEAVPLAKKFHKKPKPVNNPSSAFAQLFGPQDSSPIPILQTTPVVPEPQQEAEVRGNQPLSTDDNWFTSSIDLVTKGKATTLTTLTQNSCFVSAISQSDGISLSGFSPEDIKLAQSEDSDLTFVLQWLLKGTEPKENDLFLAAPAAKNYWLHKEIFFLDEHNILRSNPKQEGANTRLVVPEQLKELVMELCHELPSAGHQGVQRTMSKIKERYHWYNMSRDIRNFVTTCDTCSKNKKPTRYGRWNMTNYHAGAPMERVHIDFMGPLPKTKSGNEHILMMVDQFTKWTECIPLPSQTAEITARAAVNEFFARFGYPFQIFSDQGRNFESSLFKSICDLLQIHKSRTTPYRPSANGQVERQNRTLMDAVRCFVDQQQDNWDEHLPQLAGAVRASVNRSTGYTPNRLMLGRETNQPADLMFGDIKEPTYQGPDEYVARFETAIRQSHQIARKTLKSTQARMKKDYDVRILEKQYKPGDLVYVLDTAQVKGKCKKLGPPWKGPGIIIKKITPFVYKVKLQRVVFNTNHDRLKLCKDRRIPAWLKTCQEKFRQGDDVLSNEKVTKASDKKYCVCKGPDTGEMMVQCDHCKEWFHLTCISITPQEAEVMDTYKCPNCQLVHKESPKEKGGGGQKKN